MNDSAGEVWQIEAEIVEVDIGQGGHAGGGVSSIEELSRPGVNYIVSQHGAITYHGKPFAPEETPRHGAHVTVLSGGHLRVNAGHLTEPMRHSLMRAVRSR